MHFSRVVEETGSFGLSVVVMFDELSDDFLKSLVFAQWRDVYENSYHRPEVRDFFFGMMIYTVENFDQLENLYSLAKNNHLRRVIVKEMIKRAKLFKHWHSAFNKALLGSQEKEIAFRGMLFSARSFSEKMVVFHLSEGETKEMIFEDLRRMAITFGENYKIYINSQDKKTRKEAFDTMVELASKDEEYLIIIECFSFGEYHDQIDIESIVDKIKEVKSLIAILHRTCACSRFEDIVLQELDKRIVNIEIWIACYDGLKSIGCINVDIFLINKLEEVAKTPEDLVKVYRKLPRKDRLSMDIFDKIVKLMKK